MNFLSLADIDKTLFHKILKKAIAGKRNRSNYQQVLAGKFIGLYFEKPSTRTRISLQVGIKQLGGDTVTLNKNDLQLSRGEDLADTARILSGYLDAITIRTFSHSTIEAFAREGSIPVINALTDLYHPCQALADYMTILENGKELSKCKVAYLGDGNNNVCHSLMLGAAFAECELTIGSPTEFAPKMEVIEAAEKMGANIKIVTDHDQACQDADALYTDVWISMGKEDETKKRKEILKPFQLNQNSINLAHKDAIILHCLPAHKGLEITEEAFKANGSRVFEQAENRLYTQKALFSYIF